MSIHTLLICSLFRTQLLKDNATSYAILMNSIYHGSLKALVKAFVRSIHLFARLSEIVQSVCGFDGQMRNDI